MEKLKLLLDVDEVICFSGYVELVNEFLSTNHKIDDFTDYYIDVAAIPEERLEEFNSFISTRNLYENPRILPKALESLKRLSEFYDIYPLTDCKNGFDLLNSGKKYKDKYDFLFSYISQDIIPVDNYIFTASKNMIKGDVQVDDLKKNLNPEIPVRILFPSYHNKNERADELAKEGILKAGDDWKEGWLFLERMLTNYAKDYAQNKHKKLERKKLIDNNS